MEFKDRVANKPNRVKVTYEDSGASGYAVVELADEPIENGTPLNRNTFETMQKELLGFKRELTSSENLDNLLDDGVYFYTTATVQGGLSNAPFENAAVIMVFGGKSTTTQKIQIAFRYGVSGQGKFRPLFNGEWGTWTYFDGTIQSETHPNCYYRIVDGEEEWINPPLEQYTEYRTSERINNKVIYKKLFAISSDDINDFLIDGTLRLDTLHEDENIVVDKVLAWTDTHILPYNERSNTEYRYLIASRSGKYIYKQAPNLAKPRNIWIEVWYYKK